MAFINLRNISLAFGGPSLFEDLSLRICKGERICLLGRNGTGKSTLLKVISGELPPDGGVIDRQQGLRIARLEQDVPRNLRGTIYEALAGGLGQAGSLLNRYHELSLRMEQGESDLHRSSPRFNMSWRVVMAGLCSSRLSRFSPASNWTPTCQCRDSREG